jgi:hypothetical protein
MPSTNGIMTDALKSEPLRQVTVYLYSPAIKAGRSAKFRKCWSGPWRVTKRKSPLNFEIVNRQGRRVIVHVNRLKRAYNPNGWDERDTSARKDTEGPSSTPGTTATSRAGERGRGARNTHPGPIPNYAPRVANPNQWHQVQIGTDGRPWTPQHPVRLQESQLVTIV